jgi:hypothetical protein
LSEVSGAGTHPPLKKAKQLVENFGRKRLRGATPSCDPPCFVAGTAVWLLTGAAFPIEELRPGDMVETSTEHSAAYGLAVVPG